MINKIIFVWIAFATLMAIIVEVWGECPPRKKERQKEKEKQRFMVWVMLPFWFPLLFIVALFRLVFYKESMAMLFKATYISLFGED